MHRDEHEGGVAAGDEDVDGAVVGDAEEAAHVRQHEETDPRHRKQEEKKNVDKRNGGREGAFAGQGVRKERAEFVIERTRAMSNIVLNTWKCE